MVTISSATAHVTLYGVTIRNGRARYFGGGISNSGTLTVSASVVSGNTSYNFCAANCSDSGGGINNSKGATLTVTGSTVSGNHATLPCTPASTSCSSVGGGINNLGSLRVNNSTISGNGALFSGGIANRGTLSVNNSTVAGNSGLVGGIGIYSGSATLQNSIVASLGGGNCAGTVTSNGYNLSSDGTCNFTNTGDLNNTDPMLGPLQYNGGQTQTMALPLGSPAVDAGNPSGCTDGLGHLLKTDQRGKPRPDAEETVGCDMGAYEYQGALQTGHCVYVCGSTRCGELTGYCSGSVNGACRSIYDPGQCPVGRPAGGYGSSCGIGIDTTRACTP